MKLLLVVCACLCLAVTPVFADCYRNATGRGAGVPISTCAAGLEQKGLLCYPYCNEGYTGVGPVCWQACPEGFTDEGALCQPNIWSGDNSGCPWYDKCGLTFAKGYKPSNPQHVPLCHPFPDAGAPLTLLLDPTTDYRDIQVREVPFLRDHVRLSVHHTGLSVRQEKLRQGCRRSPGLRSRPRVLLLLLPEPRSNGSPLLINRESGALCYPHCPAGMRGEGPVCWGSCPAGTSLCGGPAGTICLGSGTSCGGVVSTVALAAAKLMLDIGLCIAASGVGCNIGDMTAQLINLYRSLNLPPCPVLPPGKCMGHV